MPFVKNSAASKKQACMPGPNSAAYKKLLAAGKAAAAKSASSAKSAKKSKFTASFSSIKSRQAVVERVKRAIWAKVLEINEAIINLALCGNYNAARALFDFAGVYSLPAPDDNAGSAPASAGEIVEVKAAQINPVDAFFKSIGVNPPCDEPEPGIAV
jgi:hypothetical protein